MSKIDFIEIATFIIVIYYIARQANGKKRYNTEILTTKSQDGKSSQLKHYFLKSLKSP